MDPSRSAPVRYQFGPFQVDVRAGELLRRGRRVSIQQKPLDLLVLLLDRAGDVVTREEAVSRLWPNGVHVDYEQGLANAVQKLRRALGDPAGSPVYIETLPRRGYRFVGAPVVVEVRDAASSAGSSRPGSPAAARALGLAAAGIVAILGVLLARDALADRIEGAWGGTPRTAPATRAHAVSPQNGEAREAFERGRHFWEQKSVEGVRRSMESFREALEHDPGFARASVGLADAWQFLGALGQVSHDEAWRSARQAARSALAMDPSLGEAYGALAEANFRFGPPGAPVEAFFRRAVELDPASAVTRQRFGDYLAAAGRLPEGLEQLRQAHELAPLDLHINVDLASLLYESALREEAMERIRMTMELDPGYPKTHYLLAAIHHREGRLDEAVDEMKRAVEMAPGVPKFVAALGVACADAGRRDEAEAALRELERMAASLHVEEAALSMLRERIAEARPAGNPGHPSSPATAMARAGGTARAPR